MYQALYRKYRSRLFKDVIGQEHVTETLRHQMISGRLSHAYLFVGTRGTGKTSCAKILSRAVNCQNPSGGEPCNECISCVGIEDGSILDVLELDAASNNRVDDVRALLDEAIYTPASVKRRVYIIDEVHMLSTAAFNALLKILEEPPEHLLFILATTELHKVPATIQSRCQRFSFKRLSPAAITSWLKTVAEREGFTLTADAADKLSALADGSMRDGLSLLDQCASDSVIDLLRVLDTIGLAGRKELLELINSVADRDISSALCILGKLYDDGKDMTSLLNEIGALVRDLLVFKLSPDSALISADVDRAGLSALSKKLPSERLLSGLDVIKDALFNVSRGGSSRLAVEMCLIRMCDERLSADTSSLLARVLVLERSASGQNQRQIPVAPPVTLSDAVNAGVSEDSLDTVPEPQNDFWSAILGLLEDDPPVYAILRKITGAQVERRENTLMIRTEGGITASLIDYESFKDAVKKVLGPDIVIHMEADNVNTEEKKRSTLDSLAAYGNVNFE